MAKLPQIIERKIGVNRGTSRLWIEGKSLSANNWNKGKRFNAVWRIQCTGESVLMYVADPAGKRKVAGTEDRPIIDTMSKMLEDICPIGEKATIEITEDRIIVTY